jgi:hypothetical protein
MTLESTARRQGLPQIAENGGGELVGMEEGLLGRSRTCAAVDLDEAEASAILGRQRKGGELS